MFLSRRQDFPSLTVDGAEPHNPRLLFALLRMSLRIAGPSPVNSGLYVCLAFSRQRNAIKVAAFSAATKPYVERLKQMRCGVTARSDILSEAKRSLGQLRHAAFAQRQATKP
jgi:hypothetical protein